MPSDSQSCEDYLRFSRQVDLCLSGELSMHEALLVKAHTPQALQALGLPDLPMLYTQSHLRLAVQPKNPKDSGRHGLELAIVKALPNLLEAPAVVLRSFTDDSRIVCMLSQVDSDGLPLIAALKPRGHGNYDGKRVRSNFVLSYYGRTEAAEFLCRGVNQGKIMAYDVRELEKLESLSALQLLGTFSSFNRSIPDN